MKLYKCFILCRTFASTTILFMGEPLWLMRIIMASISHLVLVDGLIKWLFLLRILSINVNRFTGNGKRRNLTYKRDMYVSEKREMELLLPLL